MALIHKTGNIFTTPTKVMAHGVNLEKCSDSGLAALVWEKYPGIHDAYEHYRDTEQLLPGGSFSAAEWDEDLNDYFTVFNLASQIFSGRNARYDLLESALTETFEILKDHEMPAIAFPQIGSGIGGLEWDYVLTMIEHHANENPEITVEVWTFG